MKTSDQDPNGGKGKKSNHTSKIWEEKDEGDEIRFFERPIGGFNGHSKGYSAIHGPLSKKGTQKRGKKLPDQEEEAI